MPERVVITGIGLLSPLGLTTQSHYAVAWTGQSGVRTIRRFDVAGKRTQFAGSVFGPNGRAAVMSLKALTGHAMGASGAIEVATLALTLLEGTIPPHPNLADVDPLCRLNHVTKTGSRYLGGLALADSFGFGGANACLLLAPWN